eukprot:TRINITY_DN9196_c0_g1_i1.p1 TRINITY_DN9196_c0_g1~~TRINITY_DN9196_c0_g1_i1.p1  ORF type:complete len:334 (+),score=50.10 TRINITY_DN9196_c0_g1_i1:119-1120(+)
MEPWVVGLTLTGVMAVCFCLYTFIPESLRGRTAAAPRSGGERMWGPNDADFDWCEPDYAVPYVAELWNTWTNAFYLVPAVFGWAIHSKIMQRDVGAMLCCLAVIGVGSALFHGTLRYWAQLADELPMHYLVIAAVYTLATRDMAPGSTYRKPAFQLTLVAAELLLTVGLYATARTSLQHQALRGWLSVTFASGFVYIFLGSAQAAKEVDAAFAGQLGWEKGAAVRLFRGAFFLFVGALVCWISDITLCPLLHALPLGLPYPQLHAVAWHGGSAAGVHYLSVLLLLRSRTKLGAPAVLRWVFGVPLLSVGGGDDKQQRGTRDPLGDVLDKYYCG